MAQWVRSVKPRGRVGEAVLARRVEPAKLWQLRSFHSDRVFLHDNLYKTRPIRTHPHECTASICTITPAARHYVYHVYYIIDLFVFQSHPVSVNLTV